MEKQKKILSVNMSYLAVVAMADIRLMTSFLDNIKVVKLKRRHGAESVLSLLRFWFYVADNKPSGILNGIEKEDIDIICGELSFSMHDAMVDLGFLDKTKKGYRVHGWEENQPWVVSAPKRKQNAIQAANKRWNAVKEKRKQQLKPNAPSMHSVYDEHAQSNAPYLTLPNLTLPRHFSMSKEFALAWIDWEKYRLEKKKPLTEISVKKQIKALSELDVVNAVACIENSIMNGYQGIFPDKTKNVKPKMTRKEMHEVYGV